ncbi:MAG: M1 family peptidase, partial [Dehalococcoidia bacterium]|nr:M1 family peptidase [Dehalococcoidia bacterium]
MTTAAAYRLPGNVLPTKYDLTLTPNLTDFTFSGDETVTIQVTEPTNRIAVNAIDLEIADAQITLENGTSLTAQNIALNEGAETATFTFGQSIPAGTAALRIRFTGTLNDQLRGFYRSQYTTPEGEERYLATTQFEATDARRALPCWDDPAVKATFQVTLVIPSDLVAISNTLVESETPQDRGTKAVRFTETPKMSTYLLAFIVGDFASVEERAPNGTL